MLVLLLLLLFVLLLLFLLLLLPPGVLSNAEDSFPRLDGFAGTVPGTGLGGTYPCPSLSGYLGICVCKGLRTEGADCEYMSPASAPTLVVASNVAALVAFAADERVKENPPSIDCKG